MRPIKFEAYSWRRPAWLLALLAVAMFVSPLDAFPPGGGRGKRPGPKPSGPSTGGPKSDTPREIPNSGSQSGWIVKFAPAGENQGDKEGAKEGDKEEVELIGILKFRPFGKGSKSITLQMTKDPEPIIEIPDAENPNVDMELLADILTKGLFCDAAWGLANPAEADKKSAKKNLAKVTLKTIDVVGTIEDIQNDYIEIKAKPKDGRLWPDTEEKELSAPAKPSVNNAQTPKAKPIPTRRLKLKLLDGVPRYTGADNQKLDAGDFEKAQSVEAKIVYGKPGILVVLIDPNSKGGDRVSDGGDKPGGRGGTRTP